MPLHSSDRQPGSWQIIKLAQNYGARSKSGFEKEVKVDIFLYHLQVALRAHFSSFPRAFLLLLLGSIISSNYAG